jgi:hypothetical protein
MTVIVVLGLTDQEQVNWKDDQNNALGRTLIAHTLKLTQDKVE